MPPPQTFQVEKPTGVAAKEGLGPHLAEGKKPRPGTSLIGSLSPRARLPPAASASWPRRTSFRAQQRCLAEARLGAVRLARRQPRFPLGRQWGCHGNRTPRTEPGAWATVAIATRGTSGPGKFRAAGANRRSHRTLGFPVSSGVTRMASGLPPKPPSAAAETSPVVFLKGTLPVWDKDAGRGEKSLRRMEESAGLHDPAYVKLRCTVHPAVWAHPCIPAVPRVFWFSGTGEERLRYNSGRCRHRLCGLAGKI